MTSLFLFICAQSEFQTIQTITFSGDYTLTQSTLYSIMNLDENSAYSKQEILNGITQLKRSGLFYELSYKEEAQGIRIHLKQKSSFTGYIDFDQSMDISRMSFGLQERNLFSNFILVGSHFEIQDEKWSQTIWTEIPEIFKNTDLLLTLYHHDQYDYYFEGQNRSRIDIERFGFKSGLRYHFTSKLSAEFEFERFNEYYTFGKDFLIESLQQERLDFRKMGLHTKLQYTSLNMDKNTLSDQLKGGVYENFFKVFSHEKESSFTYNLTSMSHYIPFYSGTIASRVLVGFSGKSSYLYPFTTDGLNSIRSSKFNELRGQQSLFINVEYRIHGYRSKDFAFQGVVFADAAYLSTEDDNEFSETNPSSSNMDAYGVGLRFELRKFYQGVFRFDFPYRHGKFNLVAGIGHFF